MKIKVKTKEIDGEKWIKFDSKFDKVRYYYGNLITVIFIIVLILLGITLFFIIFKYVALIKANPCKLCEDLGFICSKLQGGSLK